jgi:hypothetical protein
MNKNEVISNQGSRKKLLSTKEISQVIFTSETSRRTKVPLLN